MTAPSATASLPRDLRVMGLIGGAHFTSHFFQLAMPPLFPLMREDLGVSYVALGLVVSLFYAGSGASQPVAGFMVDRYGARPVLLAGLVLLAGAIGLAGLSPWYGALLPLAVLAGLGNGVFHPADYSLINAAVDVRRVGRAYSVHQLTGTLGYAAGPAVVVTLGTAHGWRTALVVCGVLGLIVTAGLATQREALGGHRPARRAERHGQGTFRRDVGLLMAMPIVSAFAYFAIYATAQIGFQTFAVTALARLYEVPLPVLAGVLTAFLLGSATGVIVGGVLTDRTGRCDAVAATGLLLGTTCMMGMALLVLTPGLAALVTAAAGLCLGLTAPARDMLIRRATPPGDSGKVFGFAYSGLDVGAACTPLLFGWLLDHGAPRAIFLTTALLLILTSVTLLGFRARRAPLPA